MQWLINPFDCLLLCCSARLSLDTMGMDSDGERDDDEERQNGVFEPTQEQQAHTCNTCPGDETDGPKLRGPCPRGRVSPMVLKQL